MSKHNEEASTPEEAWDILRKAMEQVGSGEEEEVLEEPPTPAKGDRDTDGIPLREKLPSVSLPLTDEATQVITVCLDEIRKYTEAIAGARSAYLGGCEITAEDILSGFSSMQSSITVGRIMEQVGVRLSIRGWK